jgi:nucleotide-binding universal stress UspA family protein
MKTVLMLTDFSANATHAAKSALMLVEKLDADILLYNTFHDLPVLPAYSAGPWVVEEYAFRKDESIAGLNHLAIQLRHILTTLTKDEYKPQIDYQCGDGPLGHNVSVIIKEKDVAFVVMGGSTNSTLNHFFFGSDTLAVIEHSPCPVLVIPPKSEVKKVKKVTLATAFELSDINAITYLVGLGKTFCFELEIVHVSPFEESENLAKEKAIYSHVDTIKQTTNVTYQQIRGKDVINRLNRLCKDSGSDMLALVHYRHGFFSNIFNKSTTEKALVNHNIPLMIIPSVMT